MSWWRRRGMAVGGRRFRAPLKVVLPTVAALGAGAAVAVGSIPGSDGTFTGCYQTVTQGASGGGTPTSPYGTLRLIDPAGNTSTDVNPSVYSCDAGTEQTVTWNQQGPRGPQGPPGPQGSSGPQGPTGPAGQSTTVEVRSTADTRIFFKLNPEPKHNAPQGSSQVPGHAGEFEMTSFNLTTEHSLNIGSQSTGSGAGKVTFNPATFVKPVDGSAPAFERAIVSGIPFKSILVKVDRVTKSGELAPLVTYTLKLASFRTLEFSAGSTPATETLEVEYAGLIVDTPKSSGSGIKHHPHP